MVCATKWVGVLCAVNDKCLCYRVTGVNLLVDQHKHKLFTLVHCTLTHQILNTNEYAHKRNHRRRQYDNKSGYIMFDLLCTA